MTLKGRVFLKRIGLGLCCMSLLCLTACVQSEGENPTPDTLDEMIENRRANNEEGMGYPITPEATLLPESDITSDYNATDGMTGGGYADGLSASSQVTAMEVAEPVASWSEMVAHSKYRATTKGRVYDPSGSQYYGEDLWIDAKHSIDEVGKDLKDALDNLYETK